MKKLKSLLIFLLLCSCSPKMSVQKVFCVGLDPNLPSIQMPWMKDNVVGFIEDFFLKISEKNKIRFQIVYEDSRELAKGLKLGHYDIIFSTMIPYNFNEDTYDFSDTFISLGPYPIVRENSPITNIQDFKNQIIAVQENDLVFLNLKNHPDWDLKIYTSDLEALNDLDNQVVDIALIHHLSAINYVEDTFYNKLKMLQIPLNDQGYRFITLQGENRDLLRLINQNLKDIDQLLDKWDLRFSTENHMSYLF